MRKLKPPFDDDRSQIILDKYGKDFCAAPWTSLHEGPGGLVSTCCKSRDPIGWSHEQSFEEMYNSSFIKEVRTQILNGEKPKQCAGCYNHEIDSVPTGNRRNSNVKSYDTIDELIKITEDDGTLPYQKPTWLDLLWSNKCNFACLGCSPSLSSTIEKNYSDIFQNLHFHKEIKGGQSKKVFMGGDWHNTNQRKIEYILKHKDTLNLLHLNGGEPFLQEGVYELLDVLIKENLTKKIGIWSHTNGSINRFKGKDLVEDYLSHWGGNCRITMSLDHYGKRGEFIRYGYKENKWWQTFKKLRKINIDVTVQICYNIFNCLTFYDFVKNLIDTIGEDLSVIPHIGIKLKFGIWHHPRPFAAGMTSLDKNLNQKAKEELEKVFEIKTLNHEAKRQVYANLYHTLESEMPLWKAQEVGQVFVDTVDRLDERRNVKFHDTFPELHHLYEKCKTLNK